MTLLEFKGLTMLAGGLLAVILISAAIGLHYLNRILGPQKCSLCSLEERLKAERKERGKKEEGLMRKVK